MVSAHLRADRPACFIFSVNRCLGVPFALGEIRLGGGEGKGGSFVGIDQIDREDAKLVQHEVAVPGEPGPLGWQLGIGQGLHSKTSQWFAAGIRGEIEKEGGSVGYQFFDEYAAIFARNELVAVLLR